MHEPITNKISKMLSCMYITFFEYLALNCNTEFSGWLHLNVITLIHTACTISSYIGSLSGFRIQSVLIRISTGMYVVSFRRPCMLY